MAAIACLLVHLCLINQSIKGHLYSAKINSLFPCTVERLESLLEQCDLARNLTTVGLKTQFQVTQTIITNEKKDKKYFNFGLNKDKLTKRDT